MLSPTLEQTLHHALALANNRHHEYATLEHLLLSLTEDQDAVAVMRACNVDIDPLREMIEDYLDHELQGLVIDELVDAKPTAGFQRVLQRSAVHVQSSGRSEVTGANVLVAIFSERESHAVYFLQQHEMSRLDAISYISHGISKTPGEDGSTTPRGTDEDIDGEPTNQAGPEALEAYCVNLNRKATEGKIDPLVGRVKGAKVTARQVTREFRPKSRRRSLMNLTIPER